MKNTEKLKEFDELGLSEKSLEAIKQKGFEKPTAIQSLIIPKILTLDTDLVGQAQTGTGKTAAFGLPVIDLITDKSHYVKVLILVPTRELAIQVSEEMNSFKGNKKINISPFYGGASYEGQIQKLKKGIDIAVGTPGRVIDLSQKGALKLENIDYMILDEADEMLNMGFKDDLERIMEFCNPARRTFLFSATMPNEILGLARNYMRKFEILEVKKEAITTDLTDQIYFEVNRNDKFEALCRIIDVEKEFYGLIFTRTKLEADDVNARLHDRGYDADCLHGDITQNNREKIFNKFKKKRINILVATDVAARGLDVSNLSHVINYSLPQDPESYVHRIGRTGRAGNEGTAITFVTPHEIRSLIQIQRNTKANIRREKIPNVKDIIEARKGWIYEQIQALINDGEIKKDFKKIALDLTMSIPAEDVVSALLQMSYKEFLDESVYEEIAEVKSKNNTRRESDYRDWKDAKPDRTGETRLFIALGKKDGMTRKSLVDLIKDKAKTHDRKINDVQVFDNYSFITVPFQEAEIILSRFKSERRGEKPIIEIAGDKKDKSERSDRDGDRGGRRSGGGRSEGRSDRGDRRSDGGGGGRFERRGGGDRDRDRGGSRDRDRDKDRDNRDFDRPRRPRK